MKRTIDPILTQIRRARAKAVSDDRRSKSAPLDPPAAPDPARRVHMAPPPKVTAESPPEVPPPVPPVPSGGGEKEKTTIKPIIDDVIIDAEVVDGAIMGPAGILDLVLRRKRT